MMGTPKMVGISGTDIKVLSVELKNATDFFLQFEEEADLNDDVQIILTLKEKTDRIKALADNLKRITDLW